MTACGTYALFGNTSGTQNAAFGYSALKSNTTGSNNTAIGQNALENNTTGYGNTASGHKSAHLTTSGFMNVSVGDSSLYTNATGDQNIAIGAKALQSNVSGNRNTAVGYDSGSANLGSGNIFLGYQSGKNETGSNKLYIENSNSTTPLIYGDFDTERIGIGISTPEDALSIRSTATDNALRVQVGTATKMRIFNNGSISFGTNNTGVSADDVYVHNQLGLGISAPTYRLELPNNAANDQGKALANAWNVYSDQRVKKDIQPLVYGIETLQQLNPVQYNHCSSSFENGILIIKDDDFTPAIGFLAQEVAQVVAEAVSIPPDESTALWSMSYEKLIPVVVKAMQEQQDIIESQQQQIDQLQKQYAEILTMLGNMQQEGITRNAQAQNK
ncbi:MAG: tail fiber domain-containing protein [Saprospiraceae bacterium]|nr:tail fiber domain-containing protein [Candidatus Opimibacter skivensis]